MTTSLFARVEGSTVGTPAPLPFSARTPQGDLRTDLAGQMAEGFLTLADIRAFGLWQVTEIKPAFDPSTRHLVEASRVKRTTDVLVTYAVAPLPPPPVPAEISDRQFARILVDDGVITADEAVAWAARGDLPDQIEGAIAALDTSIQLDVRLALSAATTYRRDHPFVALLAQILVNPATGQPYDSDALDSIWRRGSALL